MLTAVVHLLPYALLATLSPVGFTATIAILRTGRARAVAFAIGVVAGQAVACSALVLIGDAATPGRSHEHSTFSGLLQIGLAFLLAGYALVVHRRAEEPAVRTSSDRSKAALERLQRVHVGTAAAVGLLLGIGGPKRLVLTALAAATIGAAGFSARNTAELVGWYCLLATMLVWVPVSAYLLLGQRAVKALDAGLGWLSRHRRSTKVYALVTVSALLIVNAIQLL